MASSFNKSRSSKVKLDLLTEINILLVVEKGIRGGICQAIYRYAKANNKCMKDQRIAISSILGCKNFI